jgi:hypothetical protein
MEKQLLLQAVLSVGITIVKNPGSGGLSKKNFTIWTRSTIFRYKKKVDLDHMSGG